ncbi:3-oxoacyl-ACP synthase III family protein [Actinomadura rubrisoli]|uniref:3-oxoacyl-ACP synthase n=1 Tax=Actinomadura rubrisoli TaxID=2530368 RepID=A0A4R5CGR6_9ACTN|nr:3-oxoacyl-[acyl-carrier-protein] synthase III C-terminal domain-containing protein [Actinomadura rubrisoli]TDD96452.1 3-oxoacyl-ACP synthase [Actinomadura rubrisoli]
MTFARIEALATCLPSASVASDELGAALRTVPDSALRLMTGISSRRWCDRNAGEDSFALANRAALACLEKSRYGPADLDVIISAPIMRIRDRRFYFEPPFAAMIADRIGAREALCFDVSNACAGVATAILIIDRMIKAGYARRGLVVSGEQVTIVTETAMNEVDRVRHPQFASLTPGDSGLALLIDGEEGVGSPIHGVDLMTFAKGAYWCVAKPSARTAGYAMYTDVARQLNDDVYSVWPVFVADMLAETGRTFASEGFDSLIFHQVTGPVIERALRHGRQAFDSPLPPSPKVVGDLGNTTTNSIFMALHRQLSDGDLGEGDKVLFVPSGSGIVMGMASMTLSALAV